MKNPQEINILITGATSGIGEFLAHNLSRDGYSLVLTGRDKEKLKNIKKELNKNSKVEVFDLDFFDRDKLEIFCSKFEKTIDVVINSAADFGPVKNIKNLAEEEILKVFYINTIIPIKLSKIFLPAMLKVDFGRIINIGSTGGLGGYALRLPYCLSKNSLIAFTKTLNLEIIGKEYGESKNVKVYCLCPGPVKGERLEKQIKSRAEYKGYSYEVSQKKFESILGRIIEPEEIYNIVSRIIKNNTDEVSEVVLFDNKLL